jgi:hypothetical protein
MVDAVLAGAPLERVAELASIEIGYPVAIVLPKREATSVWPASAEAGDALERFRAARVDGRPVEVPRGLELVVPIVSGGEVVGSVAALGSGGTMPAETSAVLHLAALATVTAFALQDAREGEAPALVEVLAGIRSGAIEGAEIGRQTGRLGCDLVRGAVVLVCDPRSKPREAVSLIGSEYPGALVGLIEERIYSILPARGGDDAPEVTVEAALDIAARLRGYGLAGISSFYQGPGDLPRAIQEAELVLGVVSTDEGMAEHLNGRAGSGVYRLLFRALVSHPEEVRSFYEDTLAPVVAYDRQYHGDLLATLQSYLANDCNMNATARSIYAHRHTVAYRLQRVRELTGLDPLVGEDRERLGLGLKAYKIVAPTLPR